LPQYCQKQLVFWRMKYCQLAWFFYSASKLCSEYLLPPLQLISCILCFFSESTL
jgi:hypothetical protein